MTQLNIDDSRAPSYTSLDPVECDKAETQEQEMLVQTLPIPLT